jgi:hypothetical protein
MPFQIDPKAQAPTAQNERRAMQPEPEKPFDPSDDLPADEYEWLQIARDAFISSTSFVDTNMRKRWEDGLRAFNNMHAAESKYNNPAYDKRSKLFRPKIRTIMRKNEAAAAAAFFSSIDVVSVEAQDASNKFETAGASVMKQLLQYRLTKSVKWFHTVLGGLQDAQNTGVCAAHIYWEYKPAKPDLTVVIEAQPKEETNDEYPAQHDMPRGAFAAEAAPVEVDIAVPTHGMTLTDAAPPEQVPPAPQPTPQGQQPAQPGAQATPAGNQPPIPPQQSETPALPPQKGPKPIADKPVVDLIPVENLRIDPGADWTDPIQSSPFVIHLIPMYYMDIKARMDTGEWYTYSEGYVRAAGDTKYDSTRTARQQTSDAYDGGNKIMGDYDVCWVQRHIHRKDEEDWEFYTLETQTLLSKPKLLKESVLHGVRPYVMGCCILETHKPYANGIQALGKDLQNEANELANQRIDNVKFVLNKKYLLKRGANQDMAGLVRNVPGGVVMVDNVEDVKELTWPDVTASSYEEQQRIDNDMSDLLGNFSAAQVMADHGVNGPARNMAMLGQSAGTLVEYTLRTFVETFVQPLLRQMVLLEQHYETDQTVLALAGKKAQLFQKFGVDAVTDELLEQELTLNVNVGMGATDPQMKTQKFMAAVTSYANVAKEPPLGLNMEEVGKELFGHLGYSDGSRFFTNDNPQVAQLQQQLQQAMMTIKQLQQQVKEKMTGHQVKLQTTQLSEANKSQIAKNKEENENLRSAMTHRVALVESDKARTHDLVMKRMEHRMNQVNHVHEKLSMRSAQ